MSAVDFVQRGASGHGGASPGVKQGLLEVSTTQKGNIGAVMRFEDGDAYRYAYFKSAVSQGKLAGIDLTSQLILTSDAPFVNSAATATDYAAASTTIYLKHSNITTAHSDGVLQGGKLMITDESSEGYRYRIKENDWTTSTSIMKFELYDGLVELVDSEDSALVVGSKYYNCEIYDASAPNMVVGVTVVDMAASEYGWIQTWGDACVLTDGAGVAGTIATGSDGVDGAVQPMGGGALINTETHAQTYEVITEPIVGYYITAQPTTEYAAVDLKLAP